MTAVNAERYFPSMSDTAALRMLHFFANLAEKKKNTPARSAQHTLKGMIECGVMHEAYSGVNPAKMNMTILTGMKLQNVAWNQGTGDVCRRLC